MLKVRIQYLICEVQLDYGMFFQPFRKLLKGHKSTLCNEYMFFKDLNNRIFQLSILDYLCFYQNVGRENQEYIIKCRIYILKQKFSNFSELYKLFIEAL